MLLGPAEPAHAAGALLYVSNVGAGTVSVVDTSSNTITANIPVGGRPKYTAVTRDGSQVFVTHQFSDIVSVINTSSDSVTTILIPVGDATNVAVDPSGAFAYVVTDTGYIVKIATATATGSAYVFEAPMALAISPDGATAYISGYSAAVIAVNTATLAVRSIIYAAVEDSWGIAVSPDGSQVYVAYNIAVFSPHATVAVISTATDQLTANVAIPGPIYNSLLAGIAVTPDGSSVYVSDEIQDRVSVISNRERYDHRHDHRAQ